ncbi:SRPBCC family protein [Chengkuizengella axinellae]|uniref:SRPBCC family protein n=1 Tax=Chengkuizengella axinellae TaxID=3064388 RepID=A0ABT9J0H8_9BACL|nr:SRPBCC family protein [Chengkuizengella sp. 2205SS18-9]MDP5275126.1 SRPBCC family protein [Chengkuizengella sp. 2205SS18-9]
MPIIKISMFIDAPPKICFDLARSIEVHMETTTQTKEKVVAGRTSGLVELHESVTWEAVHFGIRQRLTAKITELEGPNMFVDEQVSGAFKHFKHTHEFIPHRGGTLMIDTFDYTSPFGVIGKLADVLFLEKYMRTFLTKRNKRLKKIAENN